MALGRYHGNYAALEPHNFHDMALGPCNFHDTALGSCNFHDTALGPYNFYDTALPYDNVNMPPLSSGMGKYTAHRPHYAALRQHYLPKGLQYCQKAGGPWADNAALGQHIVSLGQYIFPYPSGRGGTIYHDKAGCGNFLEGGF